MKRRNSSKGNPSHSHTLGLPKVLSVIRYEKLTQVVPVKLQPTLARLVKELGVSPWIRETILMRLQKEDLAC